MAEMLSYDEIEEGQEYLHVRTQGRVNAVRKKTSGAGPMESYDADPLSGTQRDNFAIQVCFKDTGEYEYVTADELSRIDESEGSASEGA